MRQLASIQRITNIQPIPGADAIDVASVLGWKVVVKKGEFQIGDLAVYMEIDSVPPDEEQYRFLWRNTEMRPNNFRIRTVKLRGQISQGILFPLKQLYEGDEFPDRAYINGEKATGQEQGAIRCVGDDVTELLGVTKYEPPLPGGASDVEGQFFDGVPKTDEDRVQSRHDLLAELQGRPFYITVKCDGASMTVATHEGTVKVASRNYRLADTPGSVYWRAARFNDSALIEFVEANPHLAVQGELVGPGVQGNRLGLTEPRCLVFNIVDRMSQRYLTRSTMEGYARNFEFDLVPLVSVGYNFGHDQESLLALAEGKYEGTMSEREGIVIRNNDAGERVSFKAISNKFLLKGGD